ncbi:transmembrane protein 131 homolog isoform X4 [Drosophila guanche]|uniref:transmembrane protein 131 homolog isoform X4 n=1 Tax=Drosophila guanche TaxID=7266 RepID=UPI0014725027|nr:transmembrane protein 131 homolog isoform X4 [Drosophila guanche]
MYTYLPLRLVLRLIPALFVLLGARVSGNNQQMQMQLEPSSEKVLEGLQESFISLPEPHTRDHSEMLGDLRIVPPHLDFGTWSVGQARTKQVTLFNQHTNRTLQLNSVVGPSPAFYSSFFGTREVPPLGNTTFSVVFLPRQLGAISTDLLIHTSFGRAEMTVRGEGSECPYRLKPLVGIKAPINATLTPEIHMYNPHERPLQILEIYSSGGEFQLELPSGGSEGPQNLWEIPPHTLKPVIRISFHGRTAGNHSAYIRIKISELEELEESILVIPVEFEILPKHTPYARNPLADFGRVATHNAEAMEFKLDMHDHNEHSSELFGSYLRNIPGLFFDPNSTSIVLDPKLFESSETINDLLVISSKSSSSSPDPVQPFTVLVRAEIFKGGLSFDGNVTKFLTGGSTADGSEAASPLERKRSLVVRNNFAMPLILYNVSLSEPIDESLLEVTMMGDALQVLLQPGDSVELLKLNLLNDEVMFKSSLRIDTNVTTFEMPVVSCSGRLHVSAQPFVLRIPQKKRERELQPEVPSLELDLGTVPYAQMSRDGYVILRNDNPMPIKITNWFFKEPKTVYSTSSFFGCLLAEDIENSQDDLNEATRLHICRYLGQGDSAVFQVAVKTYIDGPAEGTLKVWTPYEVVRVPVKFKASMGQLDIDQEQLSFKNCFPGKICTAVLSIRSSFTHPVHVKSISFAKPGLRFKDFNAKGTTIAAQTLTKVGRIYFEPTAMCQSQCYIRDSTNDQAVFPSIPGGGSLSGEPSSINNNLLYDGVELRQRTELYRQFKRQLQALTLTLHSDELPPLELDFAIAVEWPKLVQFQPIPPTPAIEISQVQRQWITLTNPSQQPLLLDYFLSDPAYARRTQLSLPHEVIDVSSTSCYLTDREVFSLPEAGGPILLPGGSSLTIPITFSAYQPEKYCTLLHVRSNLTLYEAVWLQARAVQSQFRFGNRRPGSLTPLLFDVPPDQFADCQSGDKAVVTVRSFTARNAGVIPMRIEGFLIGSLPCEDYGFKVMDCAGFDLGENETRKVEIAFSSDLTTSRVKRTLTLITNLTYDIGYFMLAQMPSDSVEQCAVHLVRPVWETSLRNAALVVLLASFCLVLVAAVFDSKAIMTQQSAYDAARYKGPVQPTFNLRNIVKMQAEEAAAKTEAVQQQHHHHHNHQQQQRARNGNQVKEVRKRTFMAPTTTTASRKSKPSWSSWGMDMNSLSKHLQKAPKPKPQAIVNPTPNPPQPTPVPVESVKPAKKSATPSPPQPAAPVRPQKKIRQTSVVVAATAAKPKTAEPSPKTAEPATKVEPKAEPSPKSEPSPVCTPVVQEVQEKPMPKPSAPQPENISPKPVKMQEPRVLKEQNGSAKKLGKTPGRERERERRKEQKATTNGTSSVGAVRKSERKQRQKQLNFGQAATSTSPPASPDTMKCITSPWETSSRVSFRDVLQTASSQAAPMDNGIHLAGAATAATVAPPVAVVEQPVAAPAAGGASAASSSDLGPIGGSRKNSTPPAMTSLWEPLSATASNSLFANAEIELPPVDDLYEQRERERQLQQQQVQWERSELVMQQQLLLQQAQQLELQQRQQEQQQKQLQQEKLLLLANMESNNWGSPWSPLGYGAWPDQPTGVVNVVRPPPGLSQLLATSHNIAQEQQQGTAAGVAAVGGIGIGAVAGAVAGPGESLPTQYDPFTSPSSIWSDTWRQSSQRNNNHNNNNHMN